MIKIAGLITKWNKYINEKNTQFAKDWNIYYNPNSEFVEISKKSSSTQRVVLIITVIFSFVTP